MNTHLPSRRSALRKGAVIFGFAAIYLLAGTGIAAAGTDSTRSFLSYDLGGPGATLSLSGGTVLRGGSVAEVFGPLRVTSKSLRDFGTAAQEGGSFLYESVFRALDNEWLGFTFSITALPETTAVVSLATLLLIMFLWPDRRRLVKDFKSIVGLRPPGRVRFEAYRRRANDDGRPRQQVWAKEPAVVQEQKAPVTAPAAKADDRRYAPVEAREDESLQPA